VSEWILNGTSAQLGYTVPITLVHSGKQKNDRRQNWQKIHKLNTTRKSKQHKMQQS